MEEGLQRLDDLIRLAGHALDLVPPGFLTYAALVQIDPGKFKGFAGFISNPAALAYGLTQGIPQPSQVGVAIHWNPPTPLGFQVFITYQFSVSLNNGVAPFSYNWDFGDGKTSSLESPLHAYGGVGYFTVSLDVIDSKGNVGASHVTVLVV